MAVWPQDVTVTVAPPPIPFGCICSYTWRCDGPGVVRNGALASCSADHSAVDAP
jgi:hypothetical protein